MPRTYETLREAFEAKVNRTEGCWLWTGNRFKRRMTDKGRRVRGSAHGRAKLVEDEVRELAHEFGVSEINIKRGRAWAHLSV